MGSFDGMNSCLGPLTGTTANVTPHALFPMVLTLAVSSAISMGGGEWEADKKAGIREVSIMALGCFSGVFAPALPFFLLPSRSMALLTSFTICLIYAIIIARIRGHRWQNYAQSVGIVLLIIIVETVLAHSMKGY